jgi:hypothetical protein
MINKIDLIFISAEIANTLVAELLKPDQIFVTLLLYELPYAVEFILSQSDDCQNRSLQKVGICDQNQRYDLIGIHILY